MDIAWAFLATSESIALIQLPVAEEWKWKLNSIIVRGEREEQKVKINLLSWKFVSKKFFSFSRKVASVQQLAIRAENIFLTETLCSLLPGHA